MIFHLYAHCTFNADNIDQALERLEKHFKRVRNGSEKVSFLRSGEMHLYPLAETYHTDLEHEDHRGTEESK